MTRWLALALTGIVLLAAGAMAVVYKVTEPETARLAGGPGAGPAEPLAAPLGAPLAEPLAEPPAPGPQPVPASQIVVAAQPPVLSSNQQVRSDQLLQLRASRRTSAFDQQNAREAARRARLGITP
jgi:hypothetical protein